MSNQVSSSDRPTTTTIRIKSVASGQTLAKINVVTPYLPDELEESTAALGVKGL